MVGIVLYPRWLTMRVALLYGLALAVFLGLVVKVDYSQHLIGGVTSVSGEPLGRDFINYWAGAKIAAAGRATQAYDLQQFHIYQTYLVGHKLSELKFFGYPPTMMLFCLPLSVATYLPGLLGWLFLGLLLCWIPLSKVIGPIPAAIALLSAPASFWVFHGGQTGFLTAALLCGGLVLLEDAPIAAGILFGALSCKPQLGILIPVALVAGRQWRAVVASGASLAVLAGLSAALFGVEIWPVFFHRLAYEGGLLDARWNWGMRMLSVFPSMRLLGASPATALAAQVLSAAAAALAVTKVWSSNCPAGIKSAALVVATFLATPYAWDYDGVALVFCAAWLVKEGRDRGFNDGEKLTALVLQLLPMITLPISVIFHLQLAPILLLLAMLVIVRRSGVSLRPEEGDVGASPQNTGIYRSDAQSHA